MIYKSGTNFNLMKQQLHYPKLITIQISFIGLLTSKSIFKRWSEFIVSRYCKRIKIVINKEKTHCQNYNRPNS